MEKKEIDPPFKPKIEKSNELNNFAKVIQLIIKILMFFLGFH